MVEQLKNKFAEVFGPEGESAVYFAPGRVKNYTAKQTVFALILRRDV